MSKVYFKRNQRFHGITIISMVVFLLVITLFNMPTVVYAKNAASIGAVSNFKSTSTTDTSINLNWKSVSGAQGYIIYKYDISKKTWVRLKKTLSKDTSYTVSKLQDGTSYQFAIKAYKTINKKEIASKTYPRVTATTKLDTITNFKASAKDTSITLTWNKVSKAQGYVIYQYDTSASTWKRIAKTSSTNPTYKVSNLRQGTSYRFAVRGYKTVNKKEILSVKYPTVSATTKLSTTSGFKASSVTANSITLKWNNTQGATSYIIYQYDTLKQTWKRLVQTTATLSYTVNDLKPGSNYQFAIRGCTKNSGKEVLSISYPKLKVTTKLETVTNFRSSSPTQNSVTLSWNAVTNTDGYIIYQYNTTQKSYAEIAKTQNTTYVIKNLNANTTYQFAVRGYKNVNGDEILSVSDSILKVTTQANVTKLYTLSAGYYTVGVDIPAGSFNITALDGYGAIRTDNFFKLFGSAGGVVHYTSFYKNMTLSNGDILNLTGELVVKLEYTQVNGTVTGRSYDDSAAFILAPGEYTVGNEIPIGTYLVQAVSGCGYVTSSGFISGNYISEMMGGSLYIGDFKNLKLADGDVLTIEENVTVKLTPSK